ncbi:hypothetical protein NM688_g7687 [Phlebia brevispora]|uniref:Uncharacterized protein n=1 Tax=Phlebia brevispora TaxID=194682 RepID=A0ACC1S2G2_9APHY|nr:hypothetical protein NM688_g7687 [Phlebia brevispora]
MYTSLIGLSTELVVDILGYLPYQQIVRCRRVSKRLCIIIDDTPALQRLIELDAAGYESCSPPSTGVAVVLDSFRKIQRIYRNPNPKVTKVPLKHIPGLSSLHWWPHQVRTFSDIAIARIQNDNRALGVLSLRSDVPEDNRFRLLKLSFDLNEYEAYPIENLLVAWSWDKIYFLSLTDGSIHNKAVILTDGELSPPEDIRDRPLLRVSVFREWMLLCLGTFHSRDDAVYLIHWPSGKTMHKWDPHQKDEDVYFPGCIVQGHVFLPTKRGHSSRVDVYRIPENSSTVDKIAHVAAYAFPNTLTTHWVDLNLEVAAAPVSGRTCRPVTSMLRMSFNSSPPMFISLQALLSRITSEESLERSPPPHTPIHVPWEAWGPNNTRVLDNIRYLAVFGRKVISEHAILDFNPYDIARNVYAPAVAHGRSLRSTGSDYSGAIRTDPTSVPHYLGFEQTITTRMPYRKTHLLLPNRNWIHGGSIIEEDGAVKLVRIATDSNNSPKHLEIFTL